MNKSGLLVRLAVVIVFSALAVSFVSAQLFYRLTYLNEVEIAHQDIEQLYQTVRATAAIAAYLSDDELAKEVINGLKTNDIVLDATLHFDGKDLTPMTASGAPLEFVLHSPFERTREVGKLMVLPNLEYIEARARDIGEYNSLALVAQAIVVTLVVIYIAYVLITRPMIISAGKLHKITPGTSDRLKVPDFHDGSELGEWVRDVNKLLDKTEQQIDQERKLRSEIEVLERRFRMLFENASNPIVLTEPLGSILLFNKAFHHLLEKADVRFKKNYGPLLKDLFEQPDQLSKAVQSALANGEIATGEYQLKNQIDGESCWVQVVVTSILSDDLKEYYHITLHDISKRRLELEQLSQRAYYDQLTQLMNRHTLEKHLQQFVERKISFVLLLMDLDGFKQVNDIYGHDTGDEILVHVAGLLKKSARRDDYACRWGGDEFVLVLKHINKAEVEKIANKLIDKIGRPYYLAESDQHVTIGVSIGVAFYPENELNVQSLLQRADQAMYAVKRRAGIEPDKHLLFCDEIQST